MVRDIVKRVEARLSAVGLSATSASKLAGAPDAIRNLQRAAKDPTRQGISTTTLMKLAPILRTTPEWLLEGKGSEEAAASSVATQVPLVSWVQAGAMGSNDAVYQYDDLTTVAAADLPAGDWIALRVEGDSMDRISPPESVIIVNRADRRLVPNGCYVIADETGAATYKRYRPAPDRFEPVSTNIAHEPIFPDGAVRVIGRVRRSTIEM